MPEGGHPAALAEGLDRRQPRRDVQVSREDDGDVERVASRVEHQVGDERGVDLLLLGVGDDPLAVRTVPGRGPAVEATHEEARLALQLLEQIGQRVPIGRGVVGVGHARVVEGAEHGRATDALHCPGGELVVVEPPVPRRAAEVLHVVLAVEKERDAHRSSHIYGRGRAVHLARRADEGERARETHRAMWTTGAHGNGGEPSDQRPGRPARWSYPRARGLCRVAPRRRCTASCGNPAWSSRCARPSGSRRA